MHRELPETSKQNADTLSLASSLNCLRLINSMENSETQHQKPHAILFAYPLQGHVIPAVHLAIKLASRGFTITFVNTHSIHRQASQASFSTATANNNSAEDNDLFAAVRDSDLDIRYMTVSDGLPVNYDRSLNHDQFMASLLHVFSAHVEELVAKVVKESVPPVTCLIADTFFVSTVAIAKKFGLICVSFWTEPALVFALYYHMDLLKINGHYACDDIRKDPIDYIPGVKVIDPKDITSYLQMTDTSTVCHQIISKAFNDAKAADFVLCNTVQDLEHDTIAALQAKIPFYPIGPIFPVGFTKSAVATSLWSESDCSHWLDTKPRGSVLYVSFGSYAHVEKKDLHEVANGLLLSNVSFLWAVRPDIVSSDDDDPLPVGFRDAVRDRSLIIPWCCQIQVLTHPATGGFLTHCGWNSVLESIWCEIPLLCFPLLTDQFTNRKLVVDDWKVGINLSDQQLITKEEVSGNIRCLMDGKSENQFKIAMKDMKKKLEGALKPNGSSEKNLECFIRDLNAKTRVQRNSFDVKLSNGN